MTKTLFIAATCLIVIAVAATGLLSFAGYSVPGPANLQKVEAQVAPNLSKQLAQKGLRLGQPIFIRIFKESRELELWMKAGQGFALFKTYPICAYSGALGPKIKEGDKQSPEGFYEVNRSRMKPDSRYHLAFNIGFPNAYDQSMGRSGSYLMVHGNCVSIGCYAMTNAQMEEIYLLADAALNRGQQAFKVHIFPFRMTEENMQKHHQSQWQDFWLALKWGYDEFEKYHHPPVEDVLNIMHRTIKTNP